MATEGVEPKRVCVVGIPYFYDHKFIVRHGNDLTSKMKPLPLIVTRGDSLVKDGQKLVGADKLIERWALGRGVGSKVEKWYKTFDGPTERDRDKKMVASCTHLVAFHDGHDQAIKRIVGFARMYGLKLKVIKV